MIISPLLSPYETVVEASVGGGVATGAGRDDVVQVARIVCPVEVE